jgi:hypothetical protein
VFFDEELLYQGSVRRANVAKETFGEGLQKSIPGSENIHAVQELTAFIMNPLARAEDCGSILPGLTSLSWRRRQ